MRYFLTVLVFFLLIRSSSGQAITGGPLSFCAGGNVTLGVSPATGITGYQWIRDGANIVGGTAATFVANTTGAYTVLLRRGALADTIIGPVQVTKNPKPATPSFTIPASQCASLPYNFAINNPMPGYTYQWNFGDATTSTGSTVSHTFNATGSASQVFSVYVKATSPAGCVSDSLRQNVTVQQTPAPILLDVNSFSPFNNCGNNTGSPVYTVNANNGTASTGTVSGYVLNWGDNTGDINLTNASFPVNHTYNTYGVFSLRISATNSTNGCVGTRVYPVVNQLNPAVGIEGPPGGSTQKCDSAGFWFKVKNYNNNSPGTTYRWDFGDLSAPITWTTPVTVDSIYHNFTRSSCELPGREFVVTVTAINGCDNTAASINNIKIFKKPEARFDINTTPSCINQPVNFLNQSITAFNGPNCNNITGYSWNFGDPASGAANISTLENPQHIYSTPGVYTVKLVATGNCGADSISKQVCITRAPVPDFTLDNAAGLCTLL